MYENGKIYQIENKITKEKYIGSTVNPLKDRFRGHSDKVNIDTENRKLYVAMKEHGIDNFVINLIEVCPCDSKKDLRLRAAHYIMLFDTIENGYNMNLPIVDVDEKTYYKHNWYKSNKDRILEKNKDKVKEYQKNYHKENKSYKSKKIY